MLIRIHPMSFRWKKISKYLQQNEKNVDGLFICDGEDDMDSIKIKILAVQSYLFRFEFINSVMVLLPSHLIFFSSVQKTVLMKEFQLDSDQKIEEIVFSGKEPEEADFNQFFSTLSRLGVKRLGYFEKEKPKGVLGDAFMERVKAEVGLADVSKEIQQFLSVKDPEDLELVRGSAKLTCQFFRKFVEDVEEVVDSGLDVPHSTISDKVDLFMEKTKQKPNKWKLKGKFYDFAYTPIIQSNSSYSLKLTSKNSEESLSSDCIILNLCGKYYEINCLVVRTLLVNPKSNDKRNYQAVLYLHRKVISSLIPGEVLSDVFQKSRASFLKRYPELEQHLPMSFGFGMGYEYKERCLSINHKNSRRVKCNQVYAIVTSLKNLTGFKSNKSYGIQLADTVVVGEDSPEVLTDQVAKSIEEVGYDFKDESDKDAPSKKVKVQQHDNYMQSKLRMLQEKSSKLEGKRVTRAALRREKIEEENKRQREREKNQRRLLEEKMEEIEKRFHEGTFIRQSDKDKKTKVEDITVYNSFNFPTNLKLSEVRTDVKKWAVLLPIHDKVVPFHVALLKNVVKQSDGEFSRIRFNFFHPGLAVPQLEFPSTESLPPETIYLQELVYRTYHHESVASLTKRIKDLRKKWVLREDSSEGESTSVDLGTKLAVLHDLKMRPSLGGKKMRGTLSAYSKGYRFVTKKNNVFELTHSNIRHAIFQPCDENMMIILHFRLHKAVQVNRKRVMDVQFFCEVGSLAEDLNDPRRSRGRFGHPNEMEEEEVERYMQQKYNDTFLSFVELVNSKADSAVEFESPFLESSFYGSPFYNNVLISPCERSLVSIVDTPLFVLSLDDVEIVSIERIDNKIKNFDIVFIFKDYSRNVQTISNIPKNDLERIREWLDTKNILFFEGGKINLRWDNILKKIRENAKEFIFENGGWRGFFDDEDGEEGGDDLVADEESSFNEGDLEEDEEEAYKDDDILDDLDDDEEDEDFLEEEDSDKDPFDSVESSKRPAKRGRKRGRK